MLKKWMFVGILMWSGVAFAQETPTLHEVATQTYRTLDETESPFGPRCEAALALLAQLEARASQEKTALMRDPNMMRSRSARSTLAYLARVGALAREARESLNAAKKSSGEKRSGHVARAQERIAGIQAASHQRR